MENLIRYAEPLHIRLPRLLCNLLARNNGKEEMRILRSYFKRDALDVCNRSRLLGFIQLATHFLSLSLLVLFSCPSISILIALCVTFLLLCFLHDFWATHKWLVPDNVLSCSVYRTVRVPADKINWKYVFQNVCICQTSNLSTINTKEIYSSCPLKCMSTLYAIRVKYHLIVCRGNIHKYFQTH